MAYSGYLLIIGGTAGTLFPMKYIAETTYKASIEHRQELSAERNNLGVLEREVALNRPSTLSFSTISGLTNTEVSEIFELLRSNYTNEAERKMSVVFYIPETDSYSDPKDMYLPDTELTIDSIDGTTIYYEPFTISLIGY